MTKINDPLALTIIFPFTITITVLFFSAYLSITHIQNYLNIQDEGIDVNAVITTTECGNHGNINYRFNFGKDTVYGHSAGCGFECANARSDDLIPVRFYAKDKNVNSCGSTYEKINDLKTSVYSELVIAILFTLLGGIAIANKLKTTNGAPMSSDNSDETN